MGDDTPLRSSARMARLGSHLAPTGERAGSLRAEPTANVFKKWLFDVWWFNDWNGNPEEEHAAAPAAPAPAEPEAPPAPSPPAGVDFATDQEAWRQFCADVRDAGVKIPMIYPHSPEKEAGLLDKLAELSGEPAPAAAAPAPVPAPPPAPPPAPVADVPDVPAVDFSGVDFATDTAAWRQLCDLARAKGLKVPTIYPHSPAREASLTEELGITGGSAPAATPAAPEVSDAPVADEPAQPAAEGSSEPAATGAVYTMDDVAEHNSRDDCWTVINDRVYDITDFISQHPGGAIILSVAGKDATDFFMELHKEEILTEVAEDYFIGTIG